MYSVDICSSHAKPGWVAKREYEGAKYDGQQSAYRFCFQQIVIKELTVPIIEPSVLSELWVLVFYFEPLFGADAILSK